MPVIDRALWRLRAVVRPPVTLGVRGMVIAEDREVLLVRHSYMSGFHLPGGAVDPGESVRAAMAREVAEETGIAVAEPGALFGVYWNRRLAGRDHVALFVVRAFEPAPAAFTAAGEIVEAGFFPLAALPEATTPATRRRLREVLSGAAAAEEW